jgi:hypothetical protein
MASPWEKYAAPAEAGPWSKYGAKAPAPKVSRVAAAGTGVEAGVGWGFRDEAEGGRAARRDLLPAWINASIDMQGVGPMAPMSGVFDTAFGLTIENDKRFKDTKARETYTKARDNRRGREEKARTDHPLSYGAGEFVGATASVPLPAAGGAKAVATGAKATAAAAKAAKRPILTSVVSKVGDVGKTLASGSAAGASYGAVAGAGSADGGVEERLSGAASGSIEGAAWGAALAPAARYAVAPLMAVAGRKLFTPADTKALRMVLKRMQKSGVALDDVRAQFDAWAKTGDVPETLAEFMGANEKGLLSALVTSSTATRSKAGDVLLGRGKDEVNRLETSFAKAMGAERGDFKAAKAEAARARVEDPEPFYAAAHFDATTGARRFLQPMEADGLISILTTSRRAAKAVRKASDYSDDMLTTATRDELDKLADWLEAGRNSRPPKISVQAADYIERTINRQYDRALKGTAEDVPAGIRTLRDAIREVIDPSGLGTARETAAERIQRGKLLDKGRSFMDQDVDAEDIDDILRGDPSLDIPAASPEGQKAFTVGAARGVSDKLRNTQDMKGFADATRQVARTPAIREKIDAVRPKVLTKKGKENKGARQTRLNRELDEAIERTAERADFTNVQLGNSRTAFRQNEVAEAAAEDGLAGHLGDLVQDLIIAGPEGAARGFVGRFGQTANNLVRQPGVLNPQINEAAADVLLATGDAIPGQLARLGAREAKDASTRLLPVAPQNIAGRMGGYANGRQGALDDPYAQDFDTAYSDDTVAADDYVLSTFAEQTPERQAQIRAEYESLLPYMSPDEQVAVRRLLDGGGP